MDKNKIKGKKVGEFTIVAIFEVDENGNIGKLLGYVVIGPNGEIHYCGPFLTLCSLEDAISLAEKLDKDRKERTER